MSGSPDIRARNVVRRDRGATVPIPRHPADPRAPCPMVVCVHHHRLVLNGPQAAVARLTADLVAAGATVLPGAAGAPPRLVWTADDPRALDALCVRHPRVAAGVERFAFLGETLERLVAAGREVTVLERRPVVGAPESGEEGEDPDPPPSRLLGGLCLDEDCVPLARAALDAAARRVAALPIDVGPGLATSSLDDALLVGAAAGRVCDQATATPLYALAPAVDGALGAIAALAAAALTTSAACAGAAGLAELRHERSWCLTEATAYAALERLWTRPGDADWPEWIMYVLAGAAAVVEDCAACLHHPAPPYVSIHTERQPTDEERLRESASRLVTTCLQALVLFDAEEADL
jgi:hypothetical protein